MTRFGKRLFGLIAAIAAIGILHAVSSHPQALAQAVSVKVYFPQGGNSLEVASGGTINVQSGGALKSDTVAEYTSATGVTVDGVLLKDGGIDSTGRITTTDGVASGTARVVGGRAYSMTAAGSAHTNSTTETVLGSYTIPANTLKQGSVLRVRYQGIATVDNAGTTLTIVLRCGPTTLTGQALISHAATDISANHIFTGEFELVARAAPGATAACVGVGRFSQPAAAGGALITAYLGSTNFATNGALLLEVTADWSAADANSCRLDILDVEIL